MRNKIMWLTSVKLLSQEFIITKMRATVSFPLFYRPSFDSHPGTVMSTLEQLKPRNICRNCSLFAYHHSFASNETTFFWWDTVCLDDKLRYSGCDRRQLFARFAILADVLYRHGSSACVVCSVRHINLVYDWYASNTSSVLSKLQHFYQLANTPGTGNDMHNYGELFGPRRGSCLPMEPFHHYVISSFA